MTYGYLPGLAKTEPDPDETNGVRTRVSLVLHTGEGADWRGESLFSNKLTPRVRIHEPGLPARFADFTRDKASASHHLELSVADQTLIEIGFKAASQRAKEGTWEFYGIYLVKYHILVALGEKQMLMSDVRHYGGHVKDPLDLFFHDKHWHE